MKIDKESGREEVNIIMMKNVKGSEGNEEERKKTELKVKRMLDFVSQVGNTTPGRK